MAHLPSFSLVLETENLANADLQDLSHSLASLKNQEIPPTYAKEVLLINSGDVPFAKLELLRETYPWITVYQAPSETDYYQAKMIGVMQASGDIVVYCDSDCIYEKTWLRNILTPFKLSEKIQVVAGETKVRGRGPYGTAMALAYIFPQYSGENTLTETSQYFLNNVAFRRDFLLHYPIPTELPLYRGNCVIHAQNIRSIGHTIWKQPQARATHAPPNGLSHFFWRFLLIGHDYYWQEYLLSQAKIQGRYRNPNSGFKGKLKILFERINKMVADKRLHLFYLPFAFPIAAIASTLILVGYIITRLQPKWVEKRGVGV
jgi:glycosyltransferase involved in cell wall biosynthesis